MALDEMPRKLYIQGHKIIEQCEGKYELNTERVYNKKPFYSRIDPTWGTKSVIFWDENKFRWIMSFYDSYPENVKSKRGDHYFSNKS